ncbi:hypothetical protein ACA910_016372 [Epithemia clementina (nom. ined.)]
MRTTTSLRLLVASICMLPIVNGLRFSADGQAGQRLLREATVEVEPERHLADGEMNVGSMYIQYEGCSSYIDRGDDYYQYWKDYNDYNENNNNANNDYNNYNKQQYKRNNYYFQNNGNRRRLEDAYMMYNQDIAMVNLVRFTLCYKSDCSKCTGQYAIDMLTFLYAYNEHKQTDLQLKCQAVKDQCYCDNQSYGNNYNGNNEYAQQKCYKQCYKQAGLSTCRQFDDYGDGYETFALEDYLACKQMDYYPSGYANYQVNNKNSAGYYNDPNQNWANSIFYVGPYCKDASQIFLGTFMDEKCTYAATHATFSSNYRSKNGEAFPYFQSPIVAVGECISCQDEEQYLTEQQKMTNYYKNNGGNQYMQRSSYYYNNNYQQQEAETNGLCYYIEEADEDTLISCVYTYENGEKNNANYAGCSYLDMLPSLDGRYSKSMSSANNLLGLQNNYTVILAAIAFVLAMTVAAVTMCDPTSIQEKKEALLVEKEIAHSPTSMGVEAVAN